MMLNKNLKILAMLLSNQLFEQELSSVPGAVALIQFLTWVTLANTPGKFGLAQPIP